MKVDCGKATTQNFVAVNGDVRVILAAVQSNYELRTIRFIFDTCLKYTIPDHNILGIEGALVVRVDIRRENDRTTIDEDEVEFRRGIDIDEKVQALRHNDAFTINWSELSAPRRYLRPEAHVTEIEKSIINAAIISDTDVETGLTVVGTDSRIGRALNLSTEN